MNKLEIVALARKENLDVAEVRILQLALLQALGVPRQIPSLLKK